VAIFILLICTAKADAGPPIRKPGGSTRTRTGMASKAIIGLSELVEQALLVRGSRDFGCLAENAQFSRSCSRNAMPGGGPRLAEEIAVMRGQDDHKYGFWACPSRVVFRSPPVISSSWLKVNMCVARGVSCFWVCDLRLVLGRIDVFYRLPLGRSLSFYLEQLHYGLGKQIQGPTFILGQPPSNVIASDPTVAIVAAPIVSGSVWTCYHC
jgi:hypothetical protein